MTFLGLQATAQRLKIDDVKQLPYGINSDAEESNPMVSADGNTLYFVRTFHPDNVGGLTGGQDIWYMHKDQGGYWGPPKNDISLNDEKNNAVIGISDRGRKVYLLNTYDTKSKHATISQSDRVLEQWSDPTSILLPDMRMKGDHHGYSMSQDGSVLLISMNSFDSKGEEDLYVSFNNDGTGWERPIHLGDSINTDGYEFAPYLMPDKKTLFFSSNGHPGEGEVDIYVSYRKSDSWDSWTTPVNLGPEINSPYFDAYFTVGNDQFGFFVSNRDGHQSSIYGFHLTDLDNPVLADNSKPKSSAELAKENKALSARLDSLEGKLNNPGQIARTDEQNDSLLFSRLQEIENRVLEEVTNRIMAQIKGHLEADIADSLVQQIKAKAKADLMMSVSTEFESAISEDVKEHIVADFTTTYQEELTHDISDHVVEEVKEEDLPKMVPKNIKYVNLPSPELVHFDFNSYFTKQEHKAAFERIADKMRRYAMLKITINGYGDNVGHPEGNLRVTKSRAVAVKAALIKTGVKSSRIKTIGHGPDNPIGDNRTDAGRAQNRRAEIVYSITPK